MESLIPDENLVLKILQTTPSLIYIYDLVNNENIYVNPETKKYLGYTPEELFEMGPELTKTMYHPDDLAQAIDNNRRVKTFQNGERLPVKFRIRHKDGYFKWFAGYEAVFKRALPTTECPQGQPIQKIGNIIDINKQVLKEQELQAIIDTSPFIYFILDAKDGTYLKAYPEQSWYTFNIEPKDFINKTVQEVWQKDCPSLVTDFYAALPEIQRAKLKDEFPFTYLMTNPKTGNEHLFESIVTKINDSQLLATVRDITETRKMIEMKVGIAGLKEQITRLSDSKKKLR